jgi:hypothetical protein
MRFDLFKVVLAAAGLFALVFVSAPCFAFRAPRAGASANGCAGQHPVGRPA